MNKYRVVYRRSDGSNGEEIVLAANRVAAFLVFEKLGIKDIVAADCFRVLEKED